MKPFDYTTFVGAIERATFEKEHQRKAQAVFLALPEENQRAVVSACSGLAGISGIGSVTAFEVFVAVARVREP